MEKDVTVGSADHAACLSTSQAFDFAGRFFAGIHGP
jgi:hypothetical protein